MLGGVTVIIAVVCVCWVGGWWLWASVVGVVATAITSLSLSNDSGWGGHVGWGAVVIAAAPVVIAIFIR